MAQVQLVKRPQRWDETFGRERIHTDMVALILSSQIFCDINPEDFPDDLSLEDIIANDCAIKQHARGDIVYGADSYQTSIFIVLSGGVRMAVAARAEWATKQQATAHQNSGLSSLLRRQHRHAVSNVTQAQKVHPRVTQLPTVLLGQNEIFGELEAMARTPRSSTAFADVDGALLLEITWPGVRELLHWSDAFRCRVEGLYRARSVEIGLKESSLFAQTDEETLASIAEQCTFESHGSFDWTHRYQRENAAGRQRAQTIEQEPVIVEQGHYLEDLFLIRSGFARVTEKIHDSEITVGFLERGGIFGLTEIAEASRSGSLPHVQHSLRAIGYTDVIRIPEDIVEKFVLSFVLSGLRHEDTVGASAPTQSPHTGQSLLDFVVDNRFINATKAMVIDTTRCVGCDDCVRACAATHDGISRFVRAGPTHANLMVANACMHCADPVCLIDCPTGAIHRDANSGSIVIDDNTCIGCATCSSACPYNNIQMREVRNPDGAILIDEDGGHHLKASKCDLCAEQSSGPACQLACPHDALMRVDIHEMNILSDRQKHT